MTTPVLPTPSLGNLATDISGAAAGFIKGLHAEQDRRRQEAMQAALLQIQAMKAMRPEAGDTQVLTVPTPEGLKYAKYNKITNRVEFVPAPGTAPGTGPGGVDNPGTPAPLQQFITTGQNDAGVLSQLATPRVQLPGQTATNVPLPPGVEPRDVRPSPIPVETPTGPQVMAVNPRRGTATPITGPGGQPLVPRAQESEVVRAQAGIAMKLANGTMDDIEQKAIAGDPASRQAVDEVVNRLALQRATFRIPIVGEGLAGVIQSGEQLGLSPEGARYLASIAALISNAVPARAGKQMTINEMLLIMREFVPGVGELDKPEAWAQKIRNRKILVNSTLEAAGAGNVRFEDMPIPPPSPSAIPPKGKYGYTRP